MERTAGWQRAGDQACRKIFFLRGNTAAVTHKSLGEQDFWQPNIVFCICKAKLPLFTLNSSLLAVLVVKHWIRQAWALTLFFFCRVVVCLFWVFMFFCLFELLKDPNGTYKPFSASVNHLSFSYHNDSIKKALSIMVLWSPTNKESLIHSLFRFLQTDHTRHVQLVLKNRQSSLFFSGCMVCEIFEGLSSETNFCRFLECPKNSHICSE